MLHDGDRNKAVIEKRQSERQGSEAVILLENRADSINTEELE